MKRKMLGVLAGALFAVTAHADNMKPGLWEASTQLLEDSAMREMKAKMSPAQRKQMEDIMAMQNIKIVGDRIVSMVCITPEIAKNAAQEMLKSATDAADQDGDCTIKPSPRAGNKVATSFTCTSQPPMSGKFEITFQSDTAYSTQLQAVQDGREMNSQGSGRWVSKDCGNVKPPEPSGR